MRKWLKQQTHLLKKAENTTCVHASLHEYNNLVLFPFCVLTFGVAALKI